MSSQDIETYPRIVHEGQYRLYEKADGTLRVQYLRNDADEEEFFELPGEMINLAKQMEAGKMNPMDFLKMGMKFMGSSLR